MSQVNFQTRAIDLCKSNDVLSLKELRKLANELNIAQPSTASKVKLCAAIGAKLNHLIEVHKNENAEVPNGFTDSITQDILYDPYILSDGFSYNKSSCEQLFKKQGDIKGPDSRTILDRAIMIVNRNLKKAVLEWLIEQGLETEEPAAENEDVEMKEESKHAGEHPDRNNFMNGIYMGDNLGENRRTRSDRMSAMVAEPVRAGSRISVENARRNTVTARSRARIATRARVVAENAEIANGQIVTENNYLQDQSGFIQLTDLPVAAGFVRVFIGRDILVIAQTGTQLTLPNNINYCLRRNFVGRSTIQWNMSDGKITLIIIGAEAEQDRIEYVFRQYGENANRMIIDDDFHMHQISVNDFISQRRNRLISFTEAMSECSEY